MNSELVKSHRQQKVAARKSHYSHFWEKPSQKGEKPSHKWEKPSHKRKDRLATQRSREENRRLRKAAQLCRAQEKHCDSYARTQAGINPLLDDGYWGSDADVFYQNAYEVVGWERVRRFRNRKEVWIREFVIDKFLPSLDEKAEWDYDDDESDNESWFVAQEANLENRYQSSL